MKKLLLSSVIILLFPLIYSCDKINELRSFDVNTDLGYEYSFYIGEQDPTTINDVFVVFINDQDILDNLSNIEEWKVDKITYQVTVYDGAPDIVLSGTLVFGSIDVDVSNINLFNLYTSGTETSFNISDQDLVNLANDIKNNASTTGITGSISGNVSGQPVWFNVYVKVYVTVRVKN
jgi:hypothetical protein